jgi:hypothetical protein
MTRAASGEKGTVLSGDIHSTLLRIEEYCPLSRNGLTVAGDFTDVPIELL